MYYNAQTDIYNRPNWLNNLTICARIHTARWRDWEAGSLRIRSMKFLYGLYNDEDDNAVVC